VHFQSAHLDVHAGRMNTEDPVRVTAKDSTMVANSLKITDKGRVILFDGEVKVMVNPAAYRTQENQGQKSP
jgi:lipopolysaccharide export system protein LptC